MPTSALLLCTHSIHHFMFRVLQALQRHFNTQLRKELEIHHLLLVCMIVCVWLLLCLLFCLHYRVTDVMICMSWWFHHNGSVVRIWNVFMYIWHSTLLLWTANHELHYCYSLGACLFLCSLHLVLASSTNKILSWLRKWHSLPISQTDQGWLLVDSSHYPRSRNINFVQYSSCTVTAKTNFCCDHCNG